MAHEIPDDNKFEELVGIDTVMRKLGVTRKTVYKWTYEHKSSGFPYYRIGRWLKFRLSEIERWLQDYRAAR